MSVAKSIAGSIAKQVPQLVALADGGGGDSPPASGDALLIETGDYLLLETGDKLLLE